MTGHEAVDQLNILLQKRYSVQTKIAEAARPIIATLLDAGRAHSAKALQELFFELDALDEQLHEFARDNPVASLEALKLMLKDK